MKQLFVPFLFLFLVRRSISIIDGFPANSFDILSQVSLLTRFPNGYTNVCGGVLIAPNIVLTAAHCVFKNDEFAVTARVILGDVNLYKQDKTEQEFWSHAMAINKKFQNGGHDANDDVAIVFLSRPAKVCESPLGAQIAQLPSTWTMNFEPTPKVPSKLQLETSVCYIAGWGKSENSNSSFSETPRQMMVKLTVKRQGKHRYLLARGAGNSRACMGDSGSPVYCFIDGKRLLVGTVSQIGSFSKINEASSSADQITFCRDFEYAIIADWRESSSRISEILEKYGQLEQLEIGQQLCFGKREL